MRKECIVCGTTDELNLKIIEFNIHDKWWMCSKCIRNENDEWTLAKEIYAEKKAYLVALSQMKGSVLD